ncbi:Uncharacterised protein [Shigella sonnei]|nr:Uncharacterised protein [Shigella sonnei]
MPLQRSESSSCRPLHRGFSPQWTFPMGAPFTASRDSCPGADAKFLAGFMAKNFVAGASHPGRWNGRGLRLPPGKSTAGNRPQGWWQEGRLLRHQAQFPHTQPETAPAGSAETGGCASSCLSESGLTTGCRQAAGSRSGRNKRQPETVTVSRNITPVPCIQPYTTF